MQSTNRQIIISNNYFENIVSQQIKYEKSLHVGIKKNSGTYLTNKIEIIDEIIDIIEFDYDIMNKYILDPACGQGIFLLRIISKFADKYNDKELVYKFINENLIFIDIKISMIEETIKNIKSLYKELFGIDYTGYFNSFCIDFTKKSSTERIGLFDSEDDNPLKNFIGKIDYIIGNPPYVTLYGRRDKKVNENQRVYYLENYKQFPDSLKNGKINYVMLFLEHSLDLLSNNAKLSFIIDISFFETAYKYTRKYILNNTKILSIDYNINEFDVASGQLILKLEKTKNNENHLVQINNLELKEATSIQQNKWNNKNDEYKFRLNTCDKTNSIIFKIDALDYKSLKDQYPKKNLRTCVMPLNMEDRFTGNEKSINNKINSYPYYQGSKSLKEKYGELFFEKYFYYDKKLQDYINDELKIELEAKGIKNKKRIGLGETIIYDYPKIYIRQSAKQIIATYDEKPSSANNSIYVFSLRDNSDSSKEYLKFLCGFINSELITFYAQKRNIIRYIKGKQPQIKISDLSTIKVPDDYKLIKEISIIVDKIYNDRNNLAHYSKIIDDMVYNFYGINIDDICFIKDSISNF